MKTQRKDDDAWARLSEASFAVDWDNETDVVYDKWRELYTSPKGKHKVAGPS